MANIITITDVSRFKTESIDLRILGRLSDKTLKSQVSYQSNHCHSLAQRFFTPATYWHDLNDERYRTENTFLAIINNEKAINSEYAENLKALHKLILVKYEDDIGVVPNESTWFGYYDADGNTIPLEDLPLYKEDKLGLKSMKEGGKLIFLTSPLGHLKLDETWFISTIIPYLKEK